jgi:rhodanese-related sulfurtransferase
MGISDKMESAVEAAKSIVTSPLPHPPDLKAQSTPKELKERLDWGEPAFTIIDVRDRESFNREHITGAMDMPLSEVASVADKSLARERDIYIYGNNDEEASQAANQLRQEGFQRVSQIQGGLEGWKAVSGPVDAIPGLL